MQSGMALTPQRLSWIVIVILNAPSGVGLSFELPSTFSDLSSAQFHKRESAQAKMLDWARQDPELAMSVLFKQSRVAIDPEARARCIEILKTLVGEEYMKEGEGYIGIALSDEIHNILGEPLPRNVIRVTEVRADTPGQKAGIQLNDLIVALESKGWQDAQGSVHFRERIRGMKPESSAALTIFRDGKLMELKVRLGRRPLSADLFFNGLNVDPDGAERAAKEAYFSRWLLQMKAKN
jgi:S1-C subfamily serine protease